MEKKLYSLRGGLKKARTQKGIKQNELAERMGVSLKTVMNWEQGLVNPDLKTMIDLCQVLDCDLDFLVGRLPESTHDIHFVHEMTGLLEPAIKKISGPQLNNTFSDVLSRLILSPHYLNLITSYNHYILALFSMRSKDTLGDAQFEEYTEDGKIILSKYSSVMHYRQQVISVMNQICDDDYVEWMALSKNPVLEMINDALSADNDSEQERK